MLQQTITFTRLESKKPKMKKQKCVDKKKIDIQWLTGLISPQAKPKRGDRDSLISRTCLLINKAVLFD